MIKTTLLIVLGLVVLAIAVICIIAMQRPDTFRVARTVRIATAPEKIFPLINDVHEFNTWNPYNKRAPEMNGSYSGPAAGPGAHYDFESKKAGSGFFEITHSAAPSQVKMRLLMTAPFAADNVITFTLVPQGSASEVTWAMEGPSPFIGKVMGVLFSMDKMIGKDFADGLANLKARVEKI